MLLGWLGLPSVQPVGEKGELRKAAQYGIGTGYEPPGIAVQRQRHLLQKTAIGDCAGPEGRLVDQCFDKGFGVARNAGSIVKPAAGPVVHAFEYRNIGNDTCENK
jgi:hypothetical protein